MQAMVLNAVCDLTKNTPPFEPVGIPVPTPSAGEILMELKTGKIRGAKVLTMEN